MNPYVRRMPLVAAALLLAVVVFSPPGLRADESNLKTYITVSQPFQVPGAVLEPHVTYVLRRVHDNNPQLVRILNEDETRVLSTFFGVSAIRMEPADDTILTFYETAPGFPKPVKTWFYPGRTIGLEFIYTKAERAEIASHMGEQAGQTVLTARATEPENFVNEPVAETETTEIAQNTESEIQREKPSETETVTEPTPLSEDQSTEAETNTANMPESSPVRELPKTAGELPLLGLLGTGCFALRMALKKF